MRHRPLALSAVLLLWGCFRATGQCLTDEMCPAGLVCERSSGQCKPGRDGGGTDGGGTDGGVLPPDMVACPIYPPGGGGGKNRPEVLVPGGQYQIEGASFTVPDFHLDVFLVT